MLAVLWAAAAFPCQAGRATVRLDEASRLELQFDSDARVLVFPQLHWTDEPELDERTTSCILISQFALATFLQANPDYELFVEASDDYLPEAYDKLCTKDFLDDFKEIFPKLAFPPSLTELSPDQADKLMRLGAPPLLYFMNRVKRVQGAIPFAESKALDEAVYARLETTGTATARIDEAGYEILTDQREQAAAKRVKAFLAENPERKVLLVFGASHDFSGHFAGMDFAVVTGMEAILEGNVTEPSTGPEAAAAKAESKLPQVPAGATAWTATPSLDLDDPWAKKPGQDGFQLPVQGVTTTSAVPGGKNRESASTW